MVSLLHTWVIITLHYHAHNTLWYNTEARQHAKEQSKKPQVIFQQVGALRRRLHWMLAHADITIFEATTQVHRIVGTWSTTNSVEGHFEPNATVRFTHMLLKCLEQPFQRAPVLSRAFYQRPPSKFQERTVASIQSTKMLRLQTTVDIVTRLSRPPQS